MRDARRALSSQCCSAAASPGWLRGSARISSWLTRGSDTSQAIVRVLLPSSRSNWKRPRWRTALADGAGRGGGVATMKRLSQADVAWPLCSTRPGPDAQRPIRTGAKDVARLDRSPAATGAPNKRRLAALFGVQALGRGPRPRGLCAKIEKAFIEGFCPPGPPRNNDEQRHDQAHL